MRISHIIADINFGDPVFQFWIGICSLILSALAIAVTIILAVRSRQRKLLTYEVVSNSSVVNVDNDVGEDLKLLLEGRVVTKVRLHMIKLSNAGNTAISPEDYPHPLNFEFNSPPYPHPLIRCGIHKTEPENLLPAHQLKNLVAINAPEQRTVMLRPPLLNPREAIFLKVLLVANHRDSTTMKVFGQIKEGIIKEYTPPATRITWRLVATGVLIAFVLGLLISNSIGLIASFAQGVCAVGSIQDGGSTSFYSAAYKEAQQYTSICPSQIAHIAVSSNSSGEGLIQLENGTLQIANSELSSPYTDQEDHKVAVIVFALVLNKSLNISSLTTNQFQGIYSGAITTWNQVDANAPKVPIKLFGRQGSSGTQASFVKYVLNENQMPGNVQITPEGSSAEVVSAVAATPGGLGYADYSDAAAASASVTILEINQIAATPALIESGIYPFWAIEHMYTRDSSPLALSFIKYVTENLPTDNSFIRLSAMNPTILASRS